MSLHYTCDDCGAKGEPRGRGQALPMGWACDVRDGRLIDLCLACSKSNREGRT